MRDALAQIVDPLVRSVIEVRAAADRGEHPALDEVKATLHDLFEEASRKAATSRDTKGSFDLARYALVYWADEVLINSTWSHAEEWRNHILEWDYFRENVGGEMFYERVEDAERLADTDPLEVFFLCVALGFQGRLGFDPKGLRRWVERAYGRIAAGEQQADRFLPDEDRSPDEAGLGPLPGQSRLLAVSVLVSVTSLLTLAGFIAALSWE